MLLFSRDCRAGRRRFALLRTAPSPLKGKLLADSVPGLVADVSARL
jgi:hypothetical protein